MDFNLSPAIEDYRKRIRAFVDQHVIPLEAEPKSYDEHENINEATLRPLAGEGARGRAVVPPDAEGAGRAGGRRRRHGGLL